MNKNDKNTKRSKTENIAENVIHKSDLELLNKMADKYDMSLVDFGRFIVKMKNDKGVRFHVRFSVDELFAVDQKANMLNLTRSKFCNTASKWFVNSDEYKNFKLTTIKETAGDRDMRVCVLFTDAEDYKSLHELSKRMSIPFSALIRYCALNYPMDKVK